jgi:hypothetical protein
VSEIVEVDDAIENVANVKDNHEALGKSDNAMPGEGTLNVKKYAVNVMAADRTPGPDGWTGGETAQERKGAYKKYVHPWEVVDEGDAMAEDAENREGDADTDERVTSGHELKAPSLTPISVHLL